MGDDGIVKIKRALISVSDKKGLEPFGESLVESGVIIHSTGGTYKALEAGGIDVHTVEELTGFPEILDGRVKTLHPVIHGGILYLRGNAEHEATASEHGLVRIDLVYVNLYPFKETVAKGLPFADCNEQIDIGGPAMLRSAAKNGTDVSVLVNSSDLPAASRQISSAGGLTLDQRMQLRTAAFEHTAAYDAMIAEHAAKHHPYRGLD